MSLLPWIMLALLGGFVVQPVSTLVHQLGHGLAVWLLARRPAVVTVGRSPWLCFAVGSVDVRVSPVPARGVVTGGECRYDVNGVSWRTRGWISLGGPIATALELAVVGALASVLWGQGMFVRSSLLVVVLGLLVSLILTLVPGPTSVDGTVILGPRDGWQARRAFVCHRLGMPIHHHPKLVPSAGYTPVLARPRSPQGRSSSE